MIESKIPVQSFAGIDAEIDRIEITSIAYNKHRGREPHLDIGVEVGKWIDEQTETTAVTHPGWKMVDGEDGAPPSRVCHGCDGVQVWKEEPETEGQWEGEHDMEACLANHEPETRVISEAHIKWLGGTSIIVRGEQLREMGVDDLEAAAGELIQKQLLIAKGENK